MNNYYSVYKGNTPGIYDTWEQCKKSITGFKKPIYRKFSTYQEAADFYENGPLNKNNDCNLILDLDNTNIDNYELIFTDGGCINNGKSNAKAAFGVYFGDNHKLNASVLLEGKQTNNSAELSGIIYALQNVHLFINNGKQICIITDSDYCLKVIKKYIYKTTPPTDFSKLLNVPNYLLIQEIYKLIYENQNINYSLFKIEDMLKFKHIHSHTGLNDKLSLGNDQADRLVALALNINTDNKKIYLNVSYNEREDAKQYGAKWDIKKKKWYILDSHDEIKKTYLIQKYNISF